MPNYIGPDAHRCPICDKRFESKRALFSHMAHTQAHDGMLEEIWRLRFLLAEAERDKEIYREQRNEWRERARPATPQELRDHVGGMKAHIMVDAAQRCAQLEPDFIRLVELAERLGQPLDLSKFAHS